MPSLALCAEAPKETKIAGLSLSSEGSETRAREGDARQLQPCHVTTGVQPEQDSNSTLRPTHGLVCHLPRERSGVQLAGRASAAPLSGPCSRAGTATVA